MGKVNHNIPKWEAKLNAIAFFLLPLNVTLTSPQQTGGGETSISWEGNTLPSSATHSLPKFHFSAAKSLLGSSWLPVRGWEAEAWGSHRMEYNDVPGETAWKATQHSVSSRCVGREALAHRHKTPGQPTVPLHLTRGPTWTLRESQPTPCELKLEPLLCITTRDIAHMDPRREEALCQLSEMEPETMDTCLSPPGLLPCGPNLTIHRGMYWMVPLRTASTSKTLTVSRHTPGNSGNSPGLRSWPRKGKWASCTLN